MARNFIFTTVCLFLGAVSLIAQDEDQCASGVIYEELMESDPVFHRSMMYLNRRIREMQDEIDQRAAVVYVIPTVVHIIHEGEAIGEGSNISDAQIFSAITAINEDFRKMTGTNGDGDGVDVEIEFCLASRDPDGNSTTGISRVDGSGLTDYAEMGIEASGSAGADEGEVKALSTWPREEYMNIWVVNEIEDNDAGSGIQGFAYFPMASPLDGITMLHNAFGTEGNVKPNTDMNRTLTHEIGHFFGCYHTFHNTSDCSVEANCETGGDRVCDTPVTPLAVSCSSPACDGTQQIENYMDYTSETCRNMFTQGQKDRMRITLISDRGTLLDSFGCVPVTEYDAGISSVQHPTGSICDPSFTPTITLTNYGSENLTSVDIDYGVDGSLSHAFSWTGNLDPGNSVEVELNPLSSSGGGHTFDIEASNPNGNPDENTGNDEFTWDFVVASGASISLVVNIDYFGQETTWMIETDGGSLVATGGPYASSSQGTIYEEVICADNGCYVLHMYDEYGDGMSFLNGTYTLSTSDSEVLAEGSGNFGAEAIHEFCVDEEVIEGNAPSANFALSESEICEGGTLDMTDSSVEIPTEWYWTFEGGTPSNSTSQNPQNIEFNSAGIYQITMTATNEFGSDSHTETIEIFDLPSIGLSNTLPSCYGYDDGMIEATVSGAGGFSFNWNTGTDDSFIENIDAGYYVVTVDDMNGCQASVSTTLDQPAALELSLTSTSPSCFGDNDGTATVQADGGAGNVSFSWSNGNSGQTADGLGAGTHSVTATDENGCDAESNVVIIGPGELQLGLTDFDIACEAQFGAAELDLTGGTGNIIVEWSTGASTSEINSLAIGNYSVTATDENGCTKTEGFEITQSEELTVILEVNPISCSGDGDGSVIATVNGGSGSYTYDWSTGHIWISISGLGEGTFSLSVIDESGCEGFAQVVLENPEPVALSVFKTDITCFGEEDGTGSASGSGGTGVISYEWDNGQQTAQAVGLDQGNHSVTVRDEHACEVTEAIQIIEPSALVGSADIVQGESCAGADGHAVINVMGGTGDYEYVWPSGQSGQSSQTLSAGVYDVVVIDDNGCETVVELTVPYDCEIDSPTTTLIASDCNAIDLYLDDYITCESVEGAEMYLWKFENAAVGIWTEEYTLGGNNQFLLADVPNMQYGIWVDVALKVLFDGVWSPYGDVCQIWLAESVPGTQLVSTDCNSEGVLVGEMIQTEPIAGATEYEWMFTSLEYQALYVSYMNSLTLSELMGLQPGTTYHISVRAKVGDMWGEFGTSCNVQMDAADGISDLGNTPDFLIYPNPGGGEKIFIDFGNLPMPTSVTQFELFNATGHLVETFRLSDELISLTRTEHYFENKLSAGVYVLRYALNDFTLEEKLIVR